jgi:SAM-dependent methyltransferase
MNRPSEHGRSERSSARREFLDIEEVSDEIRQRVRRKSNLLQRQVPDAAPAEDFSTRIDISSTPLTGAERLWRDILITESLVGGLPPSPPTLRGRIGRTIIQLVQRCLFWFTPQIQAFQKQVAIAAKEQVAALQYLTVHLSRLEKEQSSRDAFTPPTASLVETMELQAEKLTAEIAARESLGSRIDAISEVLREVSPGVGDIEKNVSTLAPLSRLARAEFQRLLLEGGSDATDRPPACGATESDEDGISYVKFQDGFRGAYEDIRNRMAVHLQHLRLEHGRADAPIVDLGCGRGEWLSLLRENNFVAYGVDSNAEMVNLCARNGLVVQKDDLLAHVANLPENSRGSITAFHVIEHLPHTALEALLDSALRVLIPGGILILETPNPANVFVGSRTFYLDPTHQRPLPSELVRFLLDSRGFIDIHVTPLHPYPESAKLGLPGNRAAEFIDQHFFGPQDYAVVCSKPR